MLNTLFAIGIVTSQSADATTDSSLGLDLTMIAIFVVVFSTASIVWELLSYLITSFFVKRAVGTGKIRYVLYDVIALFIVVFALPVILITVLILFNLYCSMDSNTRRKA